MLTPCPIQPQIKDGFNCTDPDTCASRHLTWPDDSAARSRLHTLPYLDTCNSTGQCLLPLFAPCSQSGFLVRGEASGCATSVCTFPAYNASMRTRECLQAAGPPGLTPKLRECRGACGADGGAAALALAAS